MSEADDKALSERLAWEIEHRDVKAELEVFEREIAKRDRQIINLVSTALTDDEVKEAGKLPKMHVPYAVTAAHERDIARRKAQSEKPMVQVNIMTVQLPAPAPKEQEEHVKVIDVEAQYRD